MCGPTDPGEEEEGGRALGQNGSVQPRVAVHGGSMTRKVRDQRFPHTDIQGACPVPSVPGCCPA